MDFFCRANFCSSSVTKEYVYEENVLGLKWNKQWSLFLEKIHQEAIWIALMRRKCQC